MNIQVTLVGKGKATLSQTNYVTSGGEGAIYRINEHIVKIFTDPDKMVRDRMTDKIELLSRIKHPFIIAPIGLVIDRQTHALGYYMEFADACEPFSRVFTTAFRQRASFTDDDATMLVHNMREIPRIAHTHGCIMVDPNELNYLMRRLQEAEPRVVDVDSWQIGSRWPGTVIMPSIRDYHTPGFTEASDWFSWAVVSFQVFTGIHPYKGTLAGYKHNEMERRMRDNASVFAPGVSLNAAVRDFGCIPARLLHWYEGVFQHGERSEPPSPRDGLPVGTAARVVRQTISTSGTLIFEQIFATKSDPAIRVYPCGIVMLSTGQIIDLGSKRSLGTILRSDGKLVAPDAEIIRTNSGWLVAEDNAFFHVTLAGATPLSLGTRISKLVRSGNRLFGVTSRGLSEIKLVEMGRPLLTISQTWGTLPEATEWFNGLGIQNALGAKYLVLPYEDDKVGFVRARELDDVNVVTAKAGHRFVSAIALNRLGDYKKLEFTFDRNHQSYTCWIGDADTPELNLAILPNGVSATIVQDGELVIFVPPSGAVRKIADKTIATDMQLFTWGDKVVYIQNGNVWWVRVK